MKPTDYAISTPTSADYPSLIDVWEKAVRATHHFLQEEHIQYFKPLILGQYFDAVELFCARDLSGRIIAFMGLSAEAVEMLFTAPDHFGHGIGRRLMEYAITERSIRKVDVNEQNPDALAFYKHLGFEVKSRSPLDGSGLPFPILHLELPHAHLPKAG